MRRLPSIITTLSAVLLAVPVGAAEPALKEVAPPEGFIDSDTELTLTGEGLAPGARVALLEGGPFTAGRVDSPGSTNDIAVFGRYAYAVGSYPFPRRDGFLAVIDAGDPGTPVVVATHETPSGASGVAASGDYAYVVGHPGFLHVVDVSDPHTPTLLGSLDTPNSAHGVAVEGDYAYVAGYAALEERGFLLIVDVGDAATPRLVGRYDTAGFVRRVAVQGEHAYLVGWHGFDDGEGFLQVIDVSDPAAPRLEGSYATSAPAFDVAVSGRAAYVVGYDWQHYGFLSVVDLADPARPSWVAGLPLSYPRDVAVVGSRVFVADAGRGALAIDVGGPRMLTVEAVFATTQEAPSGIAVAGDHAFVSTEPFYLPGGDAAADESEPSEDGGPRYQVEVLNVAALDPPRIAGRHDTPEKTSAVAVAGDLVYVAGRHSGSSGGAYLRVIDAGDPREPTLVGGYDHPGLRATPDVAVSGSHAYLAAGGVLAIDISDPGAPTLAGSASGPAQYLAVAGDYLYTTHPIFGLRIYDLDNPGAPELVGSYDTPGQARGVAVDETHAYVADYSSLVILDVGSVAAPFLEAVYDTPGLAMDVAVGGKHAYVVGRELAFPYTGFLHVVDVHDPGDPTLVGSLETPGPLSRVLVEDGYVHAIGWRSDLNGPYLHVVDVGDPGDPAIVAGYHLPDSTVESAISDGHAYVVDRVQGLHVIRLNPPLRDTRVVSPSEATTTVPAGVNPGPYHVLVSNPDGESAMLGNGFRAACVPRDLAPALEPRVELEPPFVTGGPVPWRLTLEGADPLLEPESRSEAALLLPPLPTAPFTVHQPGDGSGRSAIELYLVPGEDEGLVVLVGDDEDEMARFWDQALESGGFALPRLDDHSYGDVILDVSRAPRSDRPPWSEIGDQPGDVIAPLQSPLRYRYDFMEHRLTEARAWGAGVDLVVESRAQDGGACETVERVSFLENLGALCLEFAAAHPELALPCDG
jgi:hypothetical protein